MVVSQVTDHYQENTESMEHTTVGSRTVALLGVAVWWAVQAGIIPSGSCAFPIHKLPVVKKKSDLEPLLLAEQH